MNRSSDRCKSVKTLNRTSFFELSENYSTKSCPKKIVKDKELIKPNTSTFMILHHQKIRLFLKKQRSKFLFDRNSLSNSKPKSLILGNIDG